MNHDLAEQTGYALVRIVQWMESVPNTLSDHSEHFYRSMKLAIQMGLGSVLFAIRAVFPSLFTHAARDVLQSVCESADVCPVLKPAAKENDRKADAYSPRSEEHTSELQSH